MRTADLLPDPRSWGELWQLAAPARRRLLLLDFDGTLAPFTVDRSRASPLPGAIERLERIAAGGATRVAIVSGRPVEELRALAPGFTGTLVGEHGWEIAAAGEAPARHLPSPSARALLERAFELALPIAEPLRLEPKGASLVLHTRGIDPLTAKARHLELLQVWTPLLRRAELELRVIDGGWELRARGHTKGTAVEELVRAAGSAPFVVYVGDDESDEDAFRLIAQRGIGFGVQVGDPGSPTWAQAHLPDVAAVGEFLEKWLRELEAVAVEEAP